MNNLLFSEKTRLADLIEANYRLLFILPRFGIHMGVGEMNVRDICLKLNISVDLFLVICNIYMYDEYLPDIKHLTNIPSEQLINYLQKSHEDYRSMRLPTLKQQLLEMVSGGPAQYVTILERFFNDYMQEVISHFNYEETVVFPYIRNLIAGKKSIDYHIDKFEENHSNIEEKLDDLKSIIIKYLPIECATDSRNVVLISLFLLEDDLNKHARIEDKVLVPLVSHLENAE